MARFEGYLVSPIFQAMLVFEQRRWPELNATSLETYGNHEIRVLAEHFKDYEIMDGFKLDAALDEWRCLKMQTIGLPFFGMRFMAFWEHLLTHYNTDLRYCNILQLVPVVILNLLDTSNCERFFSRRNRIQTDARAALLVTHTNDIMTADLLGPPLADFDPKVILPRWLQGRLGTSSTRGRYLQGKLNQILSNA